VKQRDFQRLKKFMQMTLSDNETEVALGLKQANAILAREGLDWNRVLDRSIVVLAEFEAMPDE